jgi:hypothetical protein
MSTAPHKISLGQALRQGDTVMQFSCVTPRTDRPAPYGGGPNVCGHHADFDIGEAIARFGAETRLSAIPAVCTVCGGREVDVRARPGRSAVHRLF